MAVVDKKSRQMSVRVDPPVLPRRQDDPFTDCVWARLETVPVNPSAARIIVTISLGAAEVTPSGFGGRVRLGLRRAKLQLRAEGGGIPHEGRWPEHETEVIVRVDVTNESRQQGATSSDYGIKAGVGAGGAKGEATIKEGGHTEQEETVRRSFSICEWGIRSGGSETRAYWAFRAMKLEDNIDLELRNREVADFLTLREEASIAYGIDFMDSDLRILASEGVLAGRAGSDNAIKWGLVLGLVRKMLAADLRRAVELPQPDREA